MAQGVHSSNNKHPLEESEQVSPEPKRTAAMDHMRQILLGASDADIEALRSVLCDTDLNHVVDSLNMKNSVWYVEPFADKVGFANKENAYRAARNKNLFDSDMLLADAVGRTVTASPSVDAPSKTILNPVPDDTVVPASSRARVRFMTPGNLMEWLSGCHTESARKLRRGLVWFYATHERAQVQKEMDAVMQELQAARAELAEKDEAIIELTAMLEDHKKVEMNRLPEPPMEIFKLFKKDNLVASMRRRPSTILARMRVFKNLQFDEVTGIEPFAEACETWDAWHKMATSMRLCYRQPLPHTNKKGKTTQVNTYSYMRVTQPVMEVMLASMTPVRADWLRGVLHRLDLVDTMQEASLDTYLAPRQQQQHPGMGVA
jgi:hypothetical protein